MKHRRGITLVDMLLAVSLLIVFLLLGSRLVVANFKTSRATLESESNAERFDQAVRVMREDVEKADSLQMPRATLLRIHVRPDQTIEWENKTGSLQRTIEKQARTWRVGQQVELKLEGNVVTLVPNPIDQIAMAPMPMPQANGGAR